MPSGGKYTKWGPQNGVRVILFKLTLTPYFCIFENNLGRLVVYLFILFDGDAGAVIGIWGMVEDDG